MTVDDLYIKGLRTTFTVTKTAKKEPNTAEVSVFNLSPDSRGRMQKKGARVVLEAGYGEHAEQVFSGDARLIEHHRDGVDWVTKIQLGDGERAYQHARVSESFKGGATVGQIVRRLIEALTSEDFKLDGAQALKVADSIQTRFAHGYTAHGRASKELDKLLAAQGYEWSIQNGRVQILRVGEPNSDTVVMLSADSGLIGSPELSTPESKKEKNAKAPPILKLKALLQPALKPGSRFALRSIEHNGTFVCTKVAHRGDTSGGDWFSDLEARKE